MKVTRRIVCGLGIGILSVCFAGDVSDPEVDREVTEHFGPGATGVFLAKNAMVSSVSAHASLAGLEILRKGGNAVDAAVAVQFALMIAEPYGSGIGGGLFAVGYNSATGKVYALDGREEAPSGYTALDFQDSKGKLKPFKKRITGGNSVGVPGTLAACIRLLEDHGTMSLSEVIAPAILLANIGLPVTETFAANLTKHWDRLSQFPETERLFSNEKGERLKAGDIHKNPDLAHTFELLAEFGEEYFYNGPLGAEIVAAVRSSRVNPGKITLGDVSNYRAVYREPSRSSFMGYSLYGMPMPSSGGVSVSMMLNFLAESGFSDLGWGSAAYIQRLIDIQNLVFADRNFFMADADFVQVPVEGLLCEDYTRERVALLKDAPLPPPLSHGTPPGLSGERPATNLKNESSHTTHFSVVDRDRNLISVTSTIEQHFGSAVPVKGRGFLLNNELTDFNSRGSHKDGQKVANAPEGQKTERKTSLGEDAKSMGGKRPRSSMSPFLVFRDGQPFMAIGSPGGSRIIGVTFQTLVNVLGYNMELQEAINAPRVIARNNKPEGESPLLRKEALIKELEEEGIYLEDAGAAGAVQAVLIRKDGWLEGAADSRREGFAIGF